MDQRPFTIYKFRTMMPDAEGKTGPVVAKPGDSRVTRLGRVLRKLSVDELPQLYNILRGDMSLVGPRPQPTYFDERYREETPRYVERVSVRPGLTGWAEVNDLRGGVPIADRTLYDVYYIENWSLVLDLKIILLTVIRMFFQPSYACSSSGTPTSWRRPPQRGSPGEHSPRPTNRPGCTGARRHAPRSLVRWCRLTSCAGRSSSFPPPFSRSRSWSPSPPSPWRRRCSIPASSGAGLIRFRRSYSWSLAPSRLRSRPIIAPRLASIGHT